MRCPICKKPVAMPTGALPPDSFFPFCSERCKLVDLGRWLDGKYQISAEETDDDQDAPPSDEA